MKNLRLILFSGVLALSACSAPVKTDNSSNTFFDLSGYFQKEASKLQQTAPYVNKEIARNNSSEKRKLKIRNWTNELGVFSASDINKPSWKDSYDVKISGGNIEYLAKDPSLRTRKIRIERKAGNEIAHIQILNSTSNSLYSSIENLDYYPDSLYVIRKDQKVILMGANNYFVSGRLK